MKYTIPTTQTCWCCGGTMHRGISGHRGPITYFTMWCNECGAIAHGAKGDDDHRIKVLETDYKFTSDRV